MFFDEVKTIIAEFNGEITYVYQAQGCVDVEGIQYEPIEESALEKLTGYQHDGSIGRPFKNLHISHTVYNCPNKTEKTLVDQLCFYDQFANGDTFYVYAADLVARFSYDKLAKTLTYTLFTKVDQ